MKSPRALPDGWQWIQPRRHFRDRREPSRSTDVHLTPSQHHGVLSQADYMAKTGSRVVLNLVGGDSMKHVEPGDFIAHLRSFQGGLETSALMGKVSNAYTVIEPLSDIDSRFYRWVFKSTAFIQGLAAGVQQLRDGQSIKFGDFASIELPQPPVDEQRRIADFLDDRVSRIDRIIAARREQIGLVKVQEVTYLQQVFDSLAVRNGVLRLGHALRRLEQGWSPQAESIPASADEWGVMKAGCVNGGRFKDEENKRLPFDLQPRTEFEIHSGDLLMSRASGSLDLIGSVAVVPGGVRERLLLCDKLYRLVPDAGWAPDYLAPMLRTRSSRDQIRLGVSGAEGMANNLPSRTVRDIEIPSATSSEQTEAVAMARAITERIESVRHALQRSIDLLTEYKSSLITAAVTGELDVTTTGSNIPG